MNLSKYKTILIDGDGVLWKSKDPIPGINPFFEFMEKFGIDWALLTNNNTQTVQNYIDKLEKFGISAGPSSVFTSSTATADYLLDRFGKGASLHVVGMKGLITTLQDYGFQTSS